MFSFTLLGQVALTYLGEPVSGFRSQKELALLIYLAHTKALCKREFIADLLWDSSSTKQSLANLRTALVRVRKQVGGGLDVTRKTVALVTDDGHYVDSLALLDGIGAAGVIDSAENAQQLLTLLETYGGDFLGDFYLKDAPRFNDWVAITREQIRQQVASSFRQLGEYALANRGFSDGLVAVRQWVDFDRLDEDANQALIELLINDGRQSEAIRLYDRYQQLLRAEVGAEPGAHMVALVDSLRMKPDPVAVDVKPIPNNIPQPHDAFFGRIGAQSDINNRLDKPWCRLVSILGQGGVGKTRLSQTIAQSRLANYPDGVWLIELADLDPDDDDLAETIATEIATILELRLTGEGTPTAQLIAHLKHKTMLLVLDNFEHVLDGADVLVEIIRRTKSIQMLVTSREALGLRSEWTIDLSGLPFPAADDDQSDCAAFDLFQARYAQWQRGEISAENQQAMRQVCRLVEGVPLAIELAAALTRGASCKEVAAQLGRGFDALTTSLRDMPPRQRSLRVVFESSWASLPPDLQLVLARLSVFRDGFTGSAARQVAETDSWQLVALRDKSLLSWNEGTERFMLHAAVREFSAEKRDPLDAISDAHCTYSLQFLAGRAKALQQDAPQLPTAEIHADIDNVRAAWRHSLNSALTLPSIAALDALSGYFQLRGLSFEAEGLMHETMLRAESYDPGGAAVATRAAVERARFLIRLGRYPQAINVLKQAIRLSTLCEDPWADGMAHVLWGEALWRQAEYVSAETKLTHALKVANRINSILLAGWCHHHLGIICDMQTKSARAIAHLERACEAWQSLNYAQALSGSLNSIGLVKFHQGDLQQALQIMEEAYAICRRLGNRQFESALLNNLSMIATEQGNLESAQRYLEQALAIAKLSGDLYSQGQAYVGLGRNAHKSGALIASAKLLEKSNQLFKEIGDRFQVARTSMLLADVMSDQGLLRDAEPLYAQTVSTARRGGNRMLECEGLIGFARVLKASDVERARHYARQALTIANSVQNFDLTKRAKEVIALLSAIEIEDRRSQPSGETLIEVQRGGGE